MFVDDIILPDQYSALTIRAQAPHCRLKDIRCPPLDSRYHLIRAADIPGRNRLAGGDVPALAAHYISYAGEPVAILAGPDRLKLEEIAGQIVVETESLKEDGGAPGKPPVFSITSAAAEVTTHIILDIEAFPINAQAAKKKERQNGVGGGGGGAGVGGGASSEEEAPAVAGADRRFVTGCYRTGVQAHWYGEPHWAAAFITDGGIGVKTAAQWPDHVRRSVAAALGLPLDAVLLDTASPSDHFDGKIWYPSLIAVHAALAAFITKRPVKLALTHMEDFLFSPKRPLSMIEFFTKLDSDGEPFETKVNIRGGFGSNGFFSGEMLRNMARAASGVYRLGRIEVNAYAVKTNLPPAGPFAGFGTAEGMFALERHVAKIADTLGTEGMEWRGRRYIEKKPQTEEAGNLMQNLMRRSDYKRKWAAYELLRRGREAEGLKISPMRGIGVTIAHTDGRQRYSIDGGGVVNLALQKPDGGAPRRGALAAAVIELEIDGIDFSAKIRGIWISVLAGKLNDKNTVRRNLLKHIICALGWTTSEKLEYEEGRISENQYFEYGVPKPSAIPKINIYFSEYDHEETDPEAVSELPYCTIPSAYLQALTQASSHHFETIPVSARDVWLILDKREQEARGEKKE